MKAKLIFDLPEESKEHKFALDGASWFGVAWDMDEYLRGKIKYGNDYISIGHALEDIRIELRQIIEGKNLNLEK